MERSTTAVTRGYGVLEGFLARQRTHMANALIPDAFRQGRILDIGCSEYPFFLMHSVFSERYGLDRISAEKEVSCTAGGPVRMLCHDIEQDRKLPFPDGFFDVVTMLAVLEHIEPARLPALMREIRRVLRPGGICILTTPAAWTDRLLRLMAAVRLISPVEIGEHKAAYTHAMIGQLFRQAGFPDGRMAFGYFELRMNIWARAGREI